MRALTHFQTHSFQVRLLAVSAFEGVARLGHGSQVDRYLLSKPAKTYKGPDPQYTIEVGIQGVELVNEDYTFDERNDRLSAESDACYLCHPRSPPNSTLRSRMVTGP